MKQYNLKGVGSSFELGKKGAVMDGTDAGSVQIKDVDGALQNAVPLAGTNANEMVLKSQLDGVKAQQIQRKSVVVAHDGGSQNVVNLTSGSTVLGVVVTATNTWTGYNDTTNIEVGDSGDTNRYFDEGFEPDGAQGRCDAQHSLGADTQITALVTQGTAGAGQARVTVLFSGSEVV